MLHENSVHQTIHWFAPIVLNEKDISFRVWRNSYAYSISATYFEKKNESSLLISWKSLFASRRKIVGISENSKFEGTHT